MIHPTRNYIIAVMARDQPGIIAAITQAVFEMGGNVIELSQTVMRSYFSLILCATLPVDKDPEVIRQRLQSAEPALGLSVNVRCYDPQPLFVPEKGAGIWFLTLQGRDRPGLISQVTSLLADLDINIEDLYTQTLGEDITMILQIHPQKVLSAQQLRNHLQALGSKLGIDAHLLHQDILRATSEVGAIRRLVRQARGGN